MLADGAVRRGRGGARRDRRRGAASAGAAPFSPPFLAGPFPVFLLESPLGQHYGFPPWRGGLLKIAKHHHRNETVDPDNVDRVVSAEDEAFIPPAVSPYIPAAARRLPSAKHCPYTLTPHRG